MTEEDEVNETVIEAYVKWLFEGNIIFVISKFVWTGMYLTAILTFQFIKAAAVIFLGALIWFVANDWQNWEIKMDDDNNQY